MLRCAHTTTFAIRIIRRVMLLLLFEGETFVFDFYCINFPPKLACVQQSNNSLGEFMRMPCPRGESVRLSKLPYLDINSLPCICYVYIMILDNQGPRTTLQLDIFWAQPCLQRSIKIELKFYYTHCLY